MLEDSVAALEPLEPAIKAAELKKVEKCDGESIRSPMNDRTCT